MQPEQPTQPLDATNPNPAPADPPVQPQTPQTASVPPIVIPISSPAVTPVPEPVMPVSSAPGMQPAPQTPLPFGPQKKSRKKLIVSAALAASVLLAGSAFVFGYFIPNQPANVWRTGMSRTGDAIEKLTDRFAEPATLETLNKNKITITGTGDFNGNKVELSVNSVLDETKSDNTASFKTALINGTKDYDVDVKVKTLLPDGAVWPNIYFNISGLKSTGLDAFYPQLMAYDGKWIAVEQDVYEQFLDPSDQDAEAQTNKVLTHEEIISILRDINSVNREYLFTDDPNKAVLVMGEFVGTEDSEGISANRYKATIHEANTAAYCKALIDKLGANQAVKKYYDLDEAGIQDAKKSCEPQEKDENSYPGSKEELDVWIDKKFKLLHKIRITDDLEGRVAYYQKQKAQCEERGQSSFCDTWDDRAETGESYTEIGQTYTGDDEFKLFMNAVVKTNKHNTVMRGDLAVKLEGLLVEGNVTYKVDEEKNKGSMEVTITTEATDDEIDASKPDGAIPIMDIYQALFEQSTQPSTIETPTAQSLGASTDGSAEDVELDIFDIFR